MKMTIYLCGLPPQNQEPRFNHEKTSNKFHWRSILQGTWPVLLKIVRQQKQENLRRYHIKEEPKETTINCNVATWMGSWNWKKKKTLDKNKDIWINYGL